MNLSKKFNRRSVAALLASTAVAVPVAAACDESMHIIGVKGDKTADVHGALAYERLPVSGAPIRRIHLKGSQLEPGGVYLYHDVHLTINGSVPPGVSISGTGGQVLVTGDMGRDSHITVEVPEHTRIKAQPCIEYDAKTGKVVVLPPSCKEMVSVPVSAKFPFNKDPAIVVLGKRGENVTLQTSRTAFTKAPPRPVRIKIPFF